MIHLVWFILVNREFIAFLAGIGSFMVATSALFVAMGANRIAQSALSQAILVADREQRDWRQRKWFDLYFKTNQAYDALERFQTLYQADFPQCRGTPEFTSDWNNLMLLIREVGAMAVVFPRNAAIDALFAATAVFQRHEEAFSRDRLARIRDAMEAIRQHALVDPTVLG